jgi:hypothetical protein
MKNQRDVASYHALSGAPQCRDEQTLRKGTTGTHADAGVGLDLVRPIGLEPITFGSGVIALCRWCRVVQSGAEWCIMASMPSSARPLRQSVSLSANVARKVRTLARAKRASTSRVIAELVESGLQAQEAERDRFLKLADRLTSSKDPAEQAQIKEELARLTFGD